MNSIKLKEINETVSSFVNATHGQIRVDIMYQKTKYRRSEAVNFGILAAQRKEIVVVLETNIVVEALYFQRARAFAYTDATFYCPIATTVRELSTIKKTSAEGQGQGFAAATTGRDIQSYHLHIGDDSDIGSLCFNAGLKIHPLYAYNIFDTSIK